MSAKSLRSLDICVAKREIAIGGSDGNVYFLDLDTFDVKQTIKTAHTNSVFSVRYTPDGKHLVTGGRDAFLKLWPLDSPPDSLGTSPYFSLFEAPAHLFTVNSIAFHPLNPILFATASRDRTIKIWEIQDTTLFLRKVVDTIRYGCHIRSVNSLFWSTFNDYLVSVSDDRSVIVWKIS